MTMDDIYTDYHKYFQEHAPHFPTASGSVATDHSAILEWMKQYPDESRRVSEYHASEAYRRICFNASTLRWKQTYGSLRKK